MVRISFTDSVAAPATQVYYYYNNYYYYYCTSIDLCPITLLSGVLRVRPHP